ncbi:uncharacterized protein LOC114406844 isoform X1 [Glycine soja]|uniref:uncharacterized protein LOC114406844 isoform X1 n=1 Tax=Glycine soja TaxID=3848 RepID=UPI0010393688|nr:uncharacterized protein LOC114406844 isoform X1 [Glycine soja]
MKGYIILGEHRGKGNWGHASNNPDSESMGPAVQVKSTRKEKQKKQERDDGMNNGCGIVSTGISGASYCTGTFNTVDCSPDGRLLTKCAGCGGKSRFCATYFEIDHANELSNSLKESANINTVRASLIVEECTRLGFGGVSLLLLLLQVTN